MIRIKYKRYITSGMLSWNTLLYMIAITQILTFSYSIMNHAANPTPTLRFGLEIELLLGPRKKGPSHSSWKSLAKDLSKRLAKAGIPNHVNDSNDKSAHNYREWSITQEVTIPSQPGKNLCMFSVPPNPLYIPVRAY